MKFKVTHIDGSRKGQVQQLDVAAITVGRDPSNVIAFDPVKDDRVSTRHATILEQGGSVILTDMGSRNGTLVNGVRIQGTVPLPSGALVQFGDGGPLCAIHFEAPAPAPAPAPEPEAEPAPPPAKTGGKGAVVVLVLLFLGVPVLGGGGYLAYRLLAGAGVSVPSIPTDPKTAAANAARRAAVESATDKPPAEKPAATAFESPWKKVGVGSVFELETTMDMEKPSPMKTTSKIKQTLVSRDDENATVKMETTVSMPGVEIPPTTNEMKFPLRSEGAKSDAKPLEEKTESVTVAGTTYSCRYVKVQSKSGDTETVSESWTTDDLPVPVKSVSSSEGPQTKSRVTMLLTRVDKK